MADSLIRASPFPPKDGVIGDPPSTAVSFVATDKASIDQFVLSVSTN